jgi:hypothetical protein
VLLNGSVNDGRAIYTLSTSHLINNRQLWLSGKPTLLIELLIQMSIWVFVYGWIRSGYFRKIAVTTLRRRLTVKLTGRKQPLHLN